MSKIKTKKEIFSFNHICENNQSIQELKDFYLFYHRREYCYQKKYEYFKRIAFGIDTASAIIITISSTLSISINPLTSIIAIASLGLSYIKKKMKFAEKADSYKKAAIVLNKVLTKIRQHLREEETDMNQLKSELSKIDENILEILPIHSIDKQEILYNKKFNL